MRPFLHNGGEEKRKRKKKVLPTSSLLPPRRLVLVDGGYDRTRRNGRSLLRLEMQKKKENSALSRRNFLPYYEVYRRQKKTRILMRRFCLLSVSLASYHILVWTSDDLIPLPPKRKRKKIGKPQ